jgi:FlaA1/EpsC-like NDP-sugar epimerase
MNEFFKNKKVMVTGGTGSLGRVLVDKLKKLDAHPIVYSRDEGKQALFFPGDSNVTKIIGDVRDYQKLKDSMALHKPDYIIHTAALKRLDDMEAYPDECIKTNINGSENVARAALAAEASKCILVSTDKACKPVNVYGASKFIAERVFTNFDYNSNSTIFASVRYGNVIASRGSFIPLWKSIIENNGTIKITSMQCTRFLFTLSKAVDTVLNSLKNEQGGEVFVPKIPSYTMATVVEAVKSTCKVENIDSEIVGMRPGEKFHEDMIAKTELPFTYEVNDDLLVILPQYTNKTHGFSNKYLGGELRSDLDVTTDHKKLEEDLIAGGINK